MMYRVTGVHPRLGPLISYSATRRDAWARARAILDLPATTRLAVLSGYRCMTCGAKVMVVHALKSKEQVHIGRHEESCG
jgi:hypothetical protein